MEYRRAKIPGGTYFFTVVTHKRNKILMAPDNVIFLREAFRHVMRRHPFKIDAFVLLPDHLHCIWTLPKEEMDFSKQWRLIKSYFTRKCDDHYKESPSNSKQKKKEQAIWQRRFWEHVIRDETDFEKHVDYIHYNPVKHGFVEEPRAWPYSSFNRYVNEGKYGLDWGGGSEMVFDENIGSE